MNREEIDKEVNEWHEKQPTKCLEKTDQTENKNITQNKIEDLIQMGNMLLAKTRKYLKAD